MSSKVLQLTAAAIFLTSFAAFSRASSASSAHAAPVGWQIARSGNGHGSTPCSVCHGMDGSGRPAAGIPRLAGQDATYLAKQLGDFHSGVRSHYMMDPVARMLTEQEIAAVAAYYASLPPPSTLPTDSTTDVLALGAWMAERGIAEKAVPACNSCHGKEGSGMAPLYPRLAGQSAAYIRAQLENLARGHRANDPAGMMRTVAAKLSPQEARAVAAFYQSLGKQSAAPAQAHP